MTLREILVWTIALAKAEPIPSERDKSRPYPTGNHVPFGYELTYIM